MTRPARPRIPALAAPALAALALAARPDAALAVDPVHSISPSLAAAVEGNSDNLFPFSGDPIRYQQIFAASDFSGGARWVTALALRPDAVNGSAFSETLSHVRIQLSTTTRTPQTLSLTFAENAGADVVTVFDGELALSSADSGPEGGPKAFDIVIPLQQPFWYDPSRGGLLLDVRNFSGGRTTQFDAQDARDSTARVWNYDAESETAKSDDPYPSVGLVVRFLGQ